MYIFGLKLGIIYRGCFKPNFKSNIGLFINFTTQCTFLRYISLKNENYVFAQIIVFVVYLKWIKDVQNLLSLRTFVQKSEYTLDI